MSEQSDNEVRRVSGWDGDRKVQCTIPGETAIRIGATGDERGSQLAEKIKSFV